MNANLEGSAVLASMELWIDLTVKCEPNGHLSVSGDVTENPGNNTHLEFEMDRSRPLEWCVSRSPRDLG